MNLTKCWLKQFKNHSFHLAKLASHIFFLTHCLALELIPTGLTSKPAVSAMPSYMHKTILTISNKHSLNILKTILDLYSNEHRSTVTRLFACYELLITTNPHLLPEMTHTITSASNLLFKLNENKLKKLSHLYRQTLQTVGFLQIRPIPTSTSSLIGHKPNLADLFSIPTPTGQLPVLPRKLQTKQSTNVNKSPTSHPENPEIKSPLPSHTVCNLSNHTLSEPELSVLSKGLTFTPTSHLDQFNLVSDVLSFGRNLKLKLFFENNPYTPNPTDVPETCLARFKSPSNFDPPPLPPDHPIELYMNFILQKVSDPKFFSELPTEPNLTVTERKAIQTLKCNDQIMILPADKGSSTVILNKSDYISEINLQLSDSLTYKKLDSDPTKEYNQELKELLLHHAKYQNLSTTSQVLLINENPSPPQFYVLPKIHKNIIPPPGRPIVASFNSVTERISAFVDDKLQPLVKQLPSHVQDTKHFLNLLSNLPQPLPPNSKLVTIDVTSLYTNIPHVHGLAAIEHFLDTRPPNTKPTTSFLLQLTQFILEKNHFQSSGTNYLQIKGTAMGTRMAPSYANLFMGRLEKTFLQKQPIQPLCWLRFIDDIFLIWTDSESNLETFLNNLQHFSPLSFTWQYSSERIIFLDVEISLKEGFLETDIHIKPTNKQQYLHYSSCHPNNTKRSLPYSLATRAKRIISSPANLENYNKQLLNAFQNRGYPTNLVQNQIRLAQSQIQPQTKNNSQRLPLVTNYHHGLHKLNHILKDGFNILKASPHTKNLLESPPTVTFRQNKNLRQILVHPKLPDPNHHNAQKINQSPGSHPCNKKSCKTCPIHLPATSFTSSSTALTYKIPGTHTCDSSNLIYQLQCQHCPAQYIGLTTETLRKRMNGHRHDCKIQNPEKPISSHSLLHKQNFDTCYTTKIVRSLPPLANNSQLRRMELAHQWITKSRDPPNLNIR